MVFNMAGNHEVVNKNVRKNMSTLNKMKRKTYVI